MTMIPPRRLEVRVYAETGQGRSWATPLDLEVSVEQTSSKRPNKASASIWGLSRDSVAWLESQGHLVELLANDQLLYRGDLRHARTRVDLPEQVTELTCGDGGRVYRDATLERSWGPGVTTSQVLADVSAVAGLAVHHLGTLDELVYEGGYYATGPIADTLDDLVRSAGGSWSIQDGAVQVVAPGAPVSGGVLLRPGTGLIGSPERGEKDGHVSAKSLLRPELRPGRLFKLESRLVSGWWRCTKVKHTASADGAKWTSEVEGKAP